MALCPGSWLPTHPPAGKSLCIYQRSVSSCPLPLPLCHFGILQCPVDDPPPPSSPVPRSPSPCSDFHLCLISASFTGCKSLLFCSQTTTTRFPFPLPLLLPCTVVAPTPQPCPFTPPLSPASFSTTLFFVLLSPDWGAELPGLNHSSSIDKL